LVAGRIYYIYLNQTPRATEQHDLVIVRGAYNINCYKDKAYTYYRLFFFHINRLKDIDQYYSITKMKTTQQASFSDEVKYCDITPEVVRQKLIKNSSGKKKRNVDIDKSVLQTILLNSDGKDNCGCSVCKYLGYNTQVENICFVASKIYYTRIVENPNYYLQYTKNKNDFLTNYINNSTKSNVSHIIFKINYLYRLFYNQQYSLLKQLTEKAQFPTSSRKHARHIVDFSFNEFRKIMSYNNKIIAVGDSISLRPKQMVCKSGKVIDKQDYIVKKISGFEMIQEDNGWLYHITETYIMRIRPSALIDLIPPNRDDTFTDSSVIAFNHMFDGSGIDLEHRENYLIIYNAEIIKKNRSNTDIFNTLKEQRPYDGDNKRYDLFTAFNFVSMMEKKICSN
jgi:hypothetical protein